MSDKHRDDNRKKTSPRPSKPDAGKSDPALRELENFIGVSEACAHDLGFKTVLLIVVIDL